MRGPVPARGPAARRRGSDREAVYRQVEPVDRDRRHPFRAIIRSTGSRRCRPRLCNHEFHGPGGRGQRQPRQSPLQSSRRSMSTVGRFRERHSGRKSRRTLRTAAPRCADRRASGPPPTRHRRGRAGSMTPASVGKNWYSSRLAASPRGCRATARSTRRPRSPPAPARGRPRSSRARVDERAGSKNESRFGQPQ